MRQISGLQEWECEKLTMDVLYRGSLEWVCNGRQEFKLARGMLFPVAMEQAL